MHVAMGANPLADTAVLATAGAVIPKAAVAKTHRAATQSCFMIAIEQTRLRQDVQVSLTLSLTLSLSVSRPPL